MLARPPGGQEQHFGKTALALILELKVLLGWSQMLILIQFLSQFFIDLFFKLKPRTLWPKRPDEAR